MAELQYIVAHLLHLFTKWPRQTFWKAYSLPDKMLYAIMLLPGIATMIFVDCHRRHKHVQ